MFIKIGGANLTFDITSNLDAFNEARLNAVLGKLNTVDKGFSNIVIKFKEDAGVQTLVVTIKHSNLYIVAINVYTSVAALPERFPVTAVLNESEIAYAGGNLALNFGIVKNAVQDAYGKVNVPGAYSALKATTIKVLAFIISEAARFETVRQAMRNIAAYDTGVTTKWENHEGILKNWMNMYNRKMAMATVEEKLVTIDEIKTFANVYDQDHAGQENEVGNSLNILGIGR